MGTAGWLRRVEVHSEDFLIAIADGRQGELLQVEFTAADLAELAAAGPDVVQYSDGAGTPRTTRAAFHDLVCGGVATDG